MVKAKKTAAKKPVAKKPPTRKYKKITAEKAEEVRQLYIHGTEDASGKRVYPSVAALAEQSGVSQALIKGRVTSEGWVDQRAVFAAKLHAEIDKKRRKEISDQAVTFDSTSLQLAKGIQAEIMQLMRAAQNDRVASVSEKERLQEIANNENRVPQDPSEPRPQKLTNPERKYLLYDFKSFTPTSLMGLAQALATAQRVGRLAFGESTENTNVHNTGPAHIKSDTDQAFELLDELIARRTAEDTGSNPKPAGPKEAGRSGGPQKLH